MADLAFDRAVAPVVRRYQFNRREKRRLGLIQLVKQARRQLVVPKRKPGSTIRTKTSKRSNAKTKFAAKKWAPAATQPSPKLKELPFSCDLSSTYEESCRTGDRTKDRGMKMMAMTVDSEMRRNLCFHGWLTEREMKEADAQNEERKRSLMMKERLDDRARLEEEKARMEKEEDQVMRAEVQANVRSRQDEELLRTMKTNLSETTMKLTITERDRMRQKVMAQTAREARHKWLDVGPKRPEEHSFRSSCYYSRSQISTRSEREREESVRARAKSNETSAERERWSHYEHLCRRMAESTLKVESMLFERSWSLRERSEERERKAKRKADYLALKRHNELAARISQKYSAAEQRIGLLRQRTEREAEAKHQLWLAAKGMNDANLERHQKKKEYFATNTRKRIDKDTMRTAEMAERVHEEIETARYTERQSALQRDRLAAALHYMAVWNVWDMGIIRSIFLGKNKLDPGSLEALIRSKTGQFDRLCRPRNGLRHNGSFSLYQIVIDGSTEGNSTSKASRGTLLRFLYDDL